MTIVGGETSRSPGPAFIDVMVTGTVRRKDCLLRSGGAPGDVLFVTGTLGGSLRAKHLDFAPRLAEAQFLAREIRPSAMMDLSDGLAADLPRLAKASGCSFKVDLEAIPRTKGCSIEQALGDGEDFELLFAVAPRKAARLENAWRQQGFRLPLTRIGTLLPRRQQSTDLRSHGHDHFA
jgi:thiamine-monophosphate kinase